MKKSKIQKENAYFCGQFRESENGETYKIKGLINEDILKKVPKCSIEDVKSAIDFAKKSQKEIYKLPIQEKIDIFVRASKILDKYEDEIIESLVKNAGQTIKYARKGFNIAKNILKSSPLITCKLHSEVIKSRYSNKLMYTLKEPLGVISIIVPINAPLLLPLTGIVAGILTGNSVILKPARQTPLPALILAKVLKEAGLPKGGFSVLTGFGSEIGVELVSNPEVKGVVFFGSSRIGREIAKECMNQTKKVMLNYSGKNPMIIMDDADIDKAVRTAVENCYVNSGQICMSTEILLIHKKIYEEFKYKFISETKKLKVGKPEDSDTDIGPIPIKKIVEGVREQIDETVSKGGKILCGGNIKNLLIEPTVIENVPKDSSLILKRTSGPVAPLIPISNLEEGISLANKSRLGFRGAIFTNNHKKIQKAISELNIAVIAINGNPFYMEEHNPHGGMEKSGISGANFLVDEMTQRKFVIDFENKK